ncbi:sugar phosphate isomerase/epimerase family protein [Cohnella lupini]|uniref:Sugar phosphate isomerase/epimerase n=1 Tax=Cohnella lupini TaxID=1294267 RepID=A0A3D9HSX5_9BACL|nr:sugar phosphate isomerase/epimerase family protein [Cohnella lupini]RED52612.1 sugar phosphate isomerase/epimerase [Cohnella lupini]
MKLSLCSIGGREAPLEEAAALASRLNYEGIELYEPHIDRYIQEGGTIGQLTALLAYVHQLTPTVVSTYGRFLGGAEEYRRCLERFENRLLPWATSVGQAPVPIRVFTDWIGSKEATVAQWKTMAGGLRELAGLAAPLGVVLLLETHQEQPTDTNDSTLRLLEDVGMDNVRVNLDVFNLYQIGEEPLRTLERLYPFISNIHLKNGFLTAGGKADYGKLLGEGDMDFVPFLRALKTLGYDGWMGVEWFGGEFAEAAALEIDWLKRTLADIDPVS